MSEEIVSGLRSRAVYWSRGNHYDDFSVGQLITHHWGRTISSADNVLFTTLTLHYNPLYTNAHYAQAHGYSDMVVCPLLIFNTVFGMSVEDLSEGGGGPFLGVDALTYHRPMLVGETIYAESEVIKKREAASRPGWGIVTWHTKGFDAESRLVVDFRRSNLIKKK